MLNVFGHVCKFEDVKVCPVWSEFGRREAGIGSAAQFAFTGVQRQSYAARAKIHKYFSKPFVCKFLLREVFQKTRTNWLRKVRELILDSDPWSPGVKRVGTQGPRGSKGRPTGSQGSRGRPTGS